MLRIGIVVGEASGDALGAGLVHEIKKLHPEAQIEGILGPGIIAEGGISHFPMSRLAVMGLTEVASEYLELVSIRNRLKHIFLANPPDVFVGVDSPDFNLALEKDLRKCGIKTVHYVSPSVWAWRKNRIYSVAQSADLLLTLFPFESVFYESVDLRIRCVGHPLAQRIPKTPDSESAKSRLGIDQNRPTIAIMPGSRKNEINSLSIPFIESAISYYSSHNEVQFVSSFTDRYSAELFQNHLLKHSTGLPLTVYTGRSHDVLEACDLALVASGTIALESMLFKKPMIICYRTSSITYYLLRFLVSSKWIGLPNILAQKDVVPELIQNDVNVKNILLQLDRWLKNDLLRQEAIDIFNRLHENMYRDTDEEAARAVLGLCNQS